MGLHLLEFNSTAVLRHVKYNFSNQSVSKILNIVYGFPITDGESLQQVLITLALTEDSQSLINLGDQANKQ